VEKQWDASGQSRRLAVNSLIVSSGSVVVLLFSSLVLSGSFPTFWCQRVFL
jgi:hypothetical protein